MELDLGDLSDWSDDDVLRTLDDFPLNEFRAKLVDSWMRYVDKHRKLTARQRACAEEILMEVYGDE